MPVYSIIRTRKPFPGIKPVKFFQKGRQVRLWRLRLAFRPGTHPLQLLGALLVPAGQQFLIRDLHTAGVAPMQAVPAGQLIPINSALPARAAAAWQWGQRAMVYQLLLPFSARSHPVPAWRRTPAGHLCYSRVGPPGVLLYIARVDPEIPVIPRRGAQGGFQHLGFGGVSGQSSPQVQPAADIGGVKRVAQCIMEGALHRDAQTGDHAFCPGSCPRPPCGGAPAKNSAAGHTRRWAGSRRCCTGTDSASVPEHRPDPTRQTLHPGRTTS